MLLDSHLQKKERKEKEKKKDLKAYDQELLFRLQVELEGLRKDAGEGWIGKGIWNWEPVREVWLGLGASHWRVELRPAEECRERRKLGLVGQGQL